jgi:hypothetical protein
MSSVGGGRAVAFAVAAMGKAARRYHKGRTRSRHVSQTPRGETERLHGCTRKGREATVAAKVTGTYSL